MNAAPSKTASPSPLLIVCVMAFAVLSLAGGWMILDVGAFSTSPRRLPHLLTVVNGPAAYVMAGIQLSGAAIAFLWVFQNSMPRWPALGLALLMAGMPIIVQIARALI